MPSGTVSGLGRRRDGAGVYCEIDLKRWVVRLRTWHALIAEPFVERGRSLIVGLPLQVPHALTCPPDGRRYKGPADSVPTLIWPHVQVV
jgi:hypothetical protein